MQFPSNIEIKENFQFKKYTTYGLGGGAKIAFFPKSESECAEIYDFVQENYSRYVILGNGSNVLASSAFFDGAIISTRQFDKINKVDNVLYC